MNRLSVDDGMASYSNAEEERDEIPWSWEAQDDLCGFDQCNRCPKVSVNASEGDPLTTGAGKSPLRPGCRHF